MSAQRALTRATSVLLAAGMLVACGELGGTEDGRLEAVGKTVDGADEIALDPGDRRLAELRDHPSGHEQGHAEQQPDDVTG